ncbi:uncharacterized protein LOC117132959 [Brassica rapa]|uniref:uncharacterized protein LOC117132959 n=1 Tax=Brassica campestris TaxID=3711 RepID=UPI00142E45F8|nr:uncharacterized protein LOC117132959 [Brassica rapa]
MYFVFLLVEMHLNSRASPPIDPPPQRPAPATPSSSLSSLPSPTRRYPSSAALASGSPTSTAKRLHQVIRLLDAQLRHDIISRHDIFSRHPELLSELSSLSDVSGAFPSSGAFSSSSRSTAALVPLMPLEALFPPEPPEPLDRRVLPRDDPFSLVFLLCLLCLLASWLFLYLFCPSVQPIVIVSRAFSDSETFGCLILFG